MGSIPGFLVYVKVYKERMIMARREHQLVKAGFTLMELLVYIAIVGIVVIVAGQAFSNSTKMRVRTQSMLKASEVAENVASLFKADIAQTGAKSSMESGGATGGDNFSDVNENVYMDADGGDSSSFDIAEVSGFSDLKVRRIRYDENGYYVAVEEVNWFVENGKLQRSCRTVVGTEDTENCKQGTSAQARARAVEIATGVTKFKVTPALPGVGATAEAQVFPPCAGGSCAEDFRLMPRTGEEDFLGVNITYSTDYKAATLSGFATNYDKNANSVNASGKIVNQVFVTENAVHAGSWKNACYKFTLDKQTEYEISFTLTDAGTAELSRMFVPGRDHMAVGFRSSKDGVRPAEIQDFLFFPPADENASGKRTMRFNVSQDIKNVCLAFTFASYSPIAADGNVTISEVTLKKVESANYKFDYPVSSFNTMDRKNVKAVRLVFSVAKNGEEGIDSLVVPIPSNGPRD